MDPDQQYLSLPPGKKPNGHNFSSFHQQELEKESEAAQIDLVQGQKSKQEPQSDCWSAQCWLKLYTRAGEPSTRGWCLRVEKLNTRKESE